MCSSDLPRRHPVSTTVSAIRDGALTGAADSIATADHAATIEVRGGESGRHQETESNAYPFTPKIYPNDLLSTIDISRLLFARNGKFLRQWIALTTPTCCAKRVKSLA